MSERPTPMVDAQLKSADRMGDSDVLSACLARRLERMVHELAEALEDCDDSPTTIYDHEEDEVGRCIHCGVMSFKDHQDECLMNKIKHALFDYAALKREMETGKKGE